MNDASSVSVDMNAVRAWSWVFALAVGAGLDWFTRRPGFPPRPSLARVCAVLVLLAVAWIWPQGLGRVQVGARGVVLRFGAPTGKTLGEGLYYVLPLAERVVQVNTRSTRSRSIGLRGRPTTSSPSTWISP